MTEQAQETYALVTGASRGLGQSFCEQLAKKGMNLILVARSEEAIKKNADAMSERYQVTCQTIALDLSTVGAAKKLYSTTEKKGWNVSLLVNNAGIGTYGSFLEQDLEPQQNLLQLNCNTLVELCHFYGRDFIASKRGGLINVASTAAFQPGPGMALYFASKSLVLNFSEALHEEWREHGVTVTTVCPGPTETSFFENANMATSSLLKKSMMKSDEVVRETLKAFEEKKPLIVPGKMNQLSSVSPRLFPRKYAAKISGFLANKMSK